MKNIIYLTVLAIFSLFVNQHFADRGAFPIDSFTNFDSASSIVLGSHPFKDYWAITGPFLDYVQAFLFLILGINWTSYVLHASIINAALTIFSFYFFLQIGLKNYYAFIYSLGVGILAYTSIGSPFVDHHSVIFCIMAFYSISIAILSGKIFFWFIVPIFISFSFFSKQIPSPYFVVLFTIIFIICTYYIKNIDKKVLLSLFGGILFSMILIFSVFIINEIPLKNFIVQYILYPFSLGENRIEKLNINFNNLINQFKFIYIILVPLIISLFFLLKIKEKNLNEKKDQIISMLFLAIIGTLIYCQLLTKNQVLIFFLIPISAALSHSYIQKYFNKASLIYFILIIFIFSTAKYHLRFNQDRKFMELVNANFELAEDSSILDKRLSGLKWITPAYLNEPLKEINLLIDAKKIISEKTEEKIIITDYLFFPSLFKNTYIANKWYDALSVPEKDNKYYDVHKDFFLQKIIKNKIKYLFFVGKDKGASDMYFFKEFANVNKCVISSELNELLLEFDIRKCKF